MKVSVIVPCYNVEEYLRDCLDSLLSQTYADFEVVCIDDGSKDSTGSILTEYANRDNRIVVHRQANAGLSAARNAGMELAQGEYVVFVDSDDKLRTETLAELVDIAEKEDLDHVAFLAEVFAHDDTVVESMAKQIESFNRFYDIPDLPEFRQPQPGAELMLRLQEKSHFIMATPLRMMKLSMLRENGLQFPVGIIHEDNIFTVNAMLAAKRAVSLPNRYYLRRVRAGSIMTSSGQTLKRLIGHTCTLTTHLEKLLLHPANETEIRALTMFLKTTTVRHCLWQNSNLSDDELREMKPALLKVSPPALRPFVEAVVCPVVEQFRGVYAKLAREQERFAARGKEISGFKKQVKEITADKDRYVSRVADLEKQLKALKADVENERRKVQLCNAEVASLKSSYAYRTGMFVTWPMRKVFRAIKSFGKK